MKQNGQRIFVAAGISLTAAIMLLIIIPAFANSGDYGINTIMPTLSQKERGVATAVATLAATAVPPTAAPATAVPTSVPPTATSLPPTDTDSSNVSPTDESTDVQPTANP